jgi:hypothetical protein
MISTIQDNFYKKTENISNDYIDEEKNISFNSESIEKNTQVKKQKKTENIKDYHKEYKKNSNWKEYLSTYVDKNKDKLNEKKRIDRRVKNDMFELVKNCIENKSIHFTNEEDFVKALELINCKNAKS